MANRSPDIRADWDNQGAWLAILNSSLGSLHKKIHARYEAKKMESSMQVWHRGLRMMGVVVVLLMAGCTAHNPLLGRWVFERYAGGGDVGSVLGGFAATISKGTMIEFTPNAMIVSQGGQATSTPIDHYVIKGSKIMVWIKTSPTLIQGQTYIVSADGREISSEIAGSGMREIFQRVPVS